MNSTFLIIIVVLLAVLVAVVAYNMYQENQYRRKIRSQFGHADQDALMGGSQSVRDGKHFNEPDPQPLRRSPILSETPPERQPETAFDRTFSPTADNLRSAAADVAGFGSRPQPAPSAPILTAERRPAAVDSRADTAAAIGQPSATASNTDSSTKRTTEPPVSVPVSETLVSSSQLSFELIEDRPLPESTPPENTAASPQARASEAQTPPAPETPLESRKQPETAAPPVRPAAADAGRGRRLLVDLDDLYRSELLWFDSRFDFMAYVSLYEAKELHALPRLSNRHRFQIIGCTRDGRFQTAEPIPGVTYQAFAIGLQAISRNGLTSAEELKHFVAQVQAFAEKMGGRVLHEDIPAFLEAARPLDDLCARVDQTIAIHLVSRASVSGTELRSVLEKHGFRLLNDGSFGLSSRSGETKYQAVALDGSAFTDALLSSQPYKGFSMLFDITRVANGEKNFNEFMNLSVALSGRLGLDLVDDQLQQLTTDWLKEVRDYVADRQNEMLAIGIEPGSSLAKRLFS